MVGLCTLGEITSDALSMDADPRLAITIPASTGGNMSTAELPLAVQSDSLEDWCACAALGIKVVT